MWVDDVFDFAEDEVSLLCLLDEILGRLESVAVHSPCDADDSLPSVDVILNWCKTMGVPRVWVSDTATHFKNRVIAQLSDALKVDHRFAVTYTPWSNGTCERMVREVVRALKFILSEQRKQVAEWVDVLPAAQ